MVCFSLPYPGRTLLFSFRCLGMGRGTILQSRAGEERKKKKEKIRWVLLIVRGVNLIRVNQ